VISGDPVVGAGSPFLLNPSKIMKIMILIFSILFSFSRVFAQEPCEVGVTEQSLRDVTEVTKKVLAQDVGKFCENTAWGLLSYSPYDIAVSSMATPNGTNGVDYMPEETMDFKAQEIKATIDTMSLYSGWQNSTVPNLKSRESLIKDVNAGGGTENLAYTLKETKSLLHQEPGAPSIPIGSHSISSLKPSEYFDEGLAGNPMVRSKICSDVTLFDALGCQNALGKMIEFAKPTEFEISGISLWKEAFTDEKYIEGTRRAALKVIARFEDPKNHEGANLYDDIFSSFKESGLSEKEAEDKTWNLIAILSTGGGNTGIRASHIKADPKFDVLKVALSAIARAAPALDLRTVKSGHPYSLPAQVHSSCDLGKPYHFWMTAFLARRAVKDGSSPKAAAAAAFVAQKGYEMKSTTAGRNPSRAFFRSSYGHWNNMMRIDTGFSSAAAVYGANAGKNDYSPIDVDKGIQEIVENGKILPKLSMNESGKLWNQNFGVGGYDRWQKLINADSGFKYQQQYLAK
jgi:hypothetical protein